MKKYLQYINNQWIENKKTFQSFNKANGQVVNEFCSATLENVNAACNAAREATKVWAGMDAESRSEYMMNAAKSRSGIHWIMKPEWAHWLVKSTLKR